MFFYQALCLIVLVGCGGKDEGAELESAAVQSVAIQSVFPIRGTAAGSQRIQLSGSGFASNMKVTMNGEDCTELKVDSPSSLTCTTPANPRGVVDILAITPSNRQATIKDAYTYRASGNGVSSFGIVATTPAQGVYPSPFSVALESVFAGFDLTTTTRTWVVDGTVYKEGDTVSFAAGSHTVSLTVKDSTGDSDTASYTVVVGTAVQAAQKVQSVQGVASSTFSLASGNAISLVNTGMFPVLNPRFIGAGKPDYVDWARYLNSLVQIGGLAPDASESSRAALLTAAWVDLSKTTEHVCSPGREAENIYDPMLLVRGYGYECCSNSARALAYLGSFLDIPARVRTTVQHEFPEFTVAGRMFILDPDMRYRYWGDNQFPLSAWTTDATPLSLMNATHFYAEDVWGQHYEVQAGGVLPYANIPAYYTSILGETIWGYREAFTGSDNTLYPGEKIVFRQASSYTPLQWLNADGTTYDGNYAPAVGKVVFRRQWSTSGSRTFQQDVGGNRTIPLNNLPYPVQDLIFYFSKPIDPKSFWLTSGGVAHQIGDFTSNTWTISAQQLREFSSLSDLAAIVSSDVALVAVDIGMQFNPTIFGDRTASAVSLSYADDSGDCQRRLSVTMGSSSTDMALGAAACDAQIPQRTRIGFDLTRDQAGASVISNYGNSYQGVWGLNASTGVKAYAEITLPRTPGLPGLLRVSDAGYFADWQINDGTGWTPLSATDLATTQWIELPASSTTTTLLRLALRQAPTVDITYLAYLSLIEGVDTARPSFVGSSVNTTSAAAKQRLR